MVVDYRHKKSPARGQGKIIESQSELLVPIVRHDVHIPRSIQLDLFSPDLAADVYSSLLSFFSFSSHRPQSRARSGYTSNSDAYIDKRCATGIP